MLASGLPRTLSPNPICFGALHPILHNERRLHEVIGWSDVSNGSQAVQSCHELLLWLIPQLDKFRRMRRFLHE